MGAWIEIKVLTKFVILTMSHPTMGAWIEIVIQDAIYKSKFSRTPRWVRGLKFSTTEPVHQFLLSHPTMGAWIEIKGS